MFSWFHPSLDLWMWTELVSISFWKTNWIPPKKIFTALRLLLHDSLGVPNHFIYIYIFFFQCAVRVCGYLQCCKVKSEPLEKKPISRYLHHMQFKKKNIFHQLFSIEFVLYTSRCPGQCTSTAEEAWSKVSWDGEAEEDSWCLTPSSLQWAPSCWRVSLQFLRGWLAKGHGDSCSSKLWKKTVSYLGSYISNWNQAIWLVYIFFYTTTKRIIMQDPFFWHIDSGSLRENIE